MKLFDAVVFGALVGFLADYWLERAGVKDITRLVLAIVAFVVTTCLVEFADWMVF